MSLGVVLTVPILLFSLLSPVSAGNNDFSQAAVTLTVREGWVGHRSEMAKNDTEELTEDILGELESALPEGYEGLADPETLAESMSLDEIWAAIISAVGGARGYVGEIMAVMLGLAVLLAVAEKGGGELSGSAAALSQAVSGTLLFALLSPLIVTVSEALETARSFMGALAPIMTSVTLAGGGTLTAGVHSSGYTVVLWAIGYLGEPLLAGLCYAMLLLGITGNMSKGGARLALSVRTVFVRLLGTVTAAFSGVIALQGIIASAQDNALMRAARHAAGTLIPMVGAGVSGAISTLAGGLAYAKGIVGGAGIVALLFLALSPLVLLLLIKFVLFVVTSFLEICHAPGAAALFTAFDGAVSALISVYVMTTIVCIIQVLLFVKGGVNFLE